MGQRLVVSVKKGEGNTPERKEIAAVYYHWSGYQFCGVCETLELANGIFSEKFSNIEDIRLRIIRFIESIGGCIDSGASDANPEYIYIEKLFPDEKFVPLDHFCSRNNGLVALSDEGRQYLHKWSEMDTTIVLGEDSRNTFIDFRWREVFPASLGKNAMKYRNVLVLSKDVMPKLTNRDIDEISEMLEGECISLDVFNVLIDDKSRWLRVYDDANNKLYSLLDD